MNTVFVPLHFLARHGRLVLVAGLVVGIVFPTLARSLQPLIPQAAALMLFVTALRIGPREAFGRLSQMRTSLGAVAVFQIAVPCLFAILFKMIGFHGPVANAIVLATTAPPISGSPNLVILTGNDPAPALRTLIAGTALLPLTIFPAFILWPDFGDAGAVLHSSFRLLALIAGATAAAFLIRAYLLKQPEPPTLTAIDGLSVLAMALVVIALMADFGPALIDRPGLLALTLIAAFALNFGLQLFVFAGIRLTGISDGHDVAYAIPAGNRNIMLFIAALPAALTSPLLLFVACYQIPMYLTPLLLGRLYRRKAVD
jgi:arsenite transporter